MKRHFKTGATTRQRLHIQQVGILLALGFIYPLIATCATEKGNDVIRF